MRGKKGPTILDQLILVDYHENYDYPDEIDFLSSGISVVRDVSRNRTPSEASDILAEQPYDDPMTNKLSSEESSKISPEGSETPVEHLYDDPATDSS